LDELLQGNRKRLSASTDLESAVRDSDITFIVVSTPSGESGEFSTEYVLNAIGQIGAALKGEDRYHLVVLTSTVMPGDTAALVLPLLERESGKRCGEVMGLCYSPEFFALGRVVYEFLNPDFILVGESDPVAGATLAKFFGELCENDPVIRRMNFVNAELTKLAVNTYITTKITFANTLARVCERMPGADVDEVTGALALDGRIGGKYLKGAIAYGGPCFPRDDLAFCQLADRLGMPARLARAVSDTNREQLEHLVSLVSSLLPEGGVLGVMGLAFKPDTAVVEESAGLDLARRLSAVASVIVYDPAATQNARAVLGASVEYAGSADDCVLRSDVLVLATPWKEFTRISPEALRREGRKPVLVDCWRVLDRARYADICEYVALGACRLKG
jgi:UDPglucose 6-dehydrogenase